MSSTSTFSALVLMASLGLPLTGVSAPVVLGELYPIAEQDLIAVLKAKSADKQVGEMLANKMQSLIKARMAHLPDATNLKRLDGFEQFTFVPTVSVPAVNGHAAKSVPLLSRIPHFRPLMVFNADDAGQIAEVKKQRALMPSLQLIATGGNLSAAMKTLGSQIFWDEKGHWSTTLKLTSLPALVTHQGGLALTVQMGLDNES